MNENTTIKDLALHELPVDQRDYSYSQRFGSIKKEELPTQDFLVAVPFEIKDQDINYPSDFCSSYGASALAEAEDLVNFVPEWTFAFAKWQLSVKNGPQEIKSFGLNLRDVCKAACDGGFLPRHDDPFKCDTQERPPRDFLADLNNWPSNTINIAGKYKKENFYAVDGPHDTFDNIRSTLWKNLPERRAVLTGAYWRWSWSMAPSGVVSTIYDTYGTPHAFAFIGQKAINNEIHLVARLSSGPKYGDNGLYYFPRSVVNKEIGKFGSFTLKDLGPIIKTPDTGVPIEKVNKWNPLWIFKRLIDIIKQ